MFKLESYITPLLMGYIDKYVKLRPEDMQLSLWGDIVLTNLDLRLDAIEHAINLPITFKSGHIHELRLHVPWTSLGSEPVVITINTIECVLKLRDDSDSSAGVDESPASAVSSSPKSTKKRQSDEVPPGYIQSLVNRVVNNFGVVVNNLILKFVEEDVVLSVNVKSAECYSADAAWSRTFVEIARPDMILRKALNFCDLTVCLDRRGASGKIDAYQDPMLYRCSLSCRMHLRYDTPHSKTPAVTRFDVSCDRFDVSLTDTQVPMFFRLVELWTAIYYGALGGAAVGEPERKKTYAKTQQASDSAVNSKTTEEAQTDHHLHIDDQQGWASWAWSYVPQVMPEFETTDEDDEGSDSSTEPPQKKPPVLAFGIYIKHAALTFKLTEVVRESRYYGSQRVAFHKFAALEGDGIALEMLLRGASFFDCQLGITSSRMYEIGPCLCGEKASDDSSTKGETFFQSGVTQTGDPVHYIEQSLFDPGGAENSGARADFIFTRDAHQVAFTESAMLDRYGCFWFDYLFTVEDNLEVEEMLGDESPFSYGLSEMDLVKENSTQTFLIGPTHVTLSSSLMHRVQKFIHCAQQHEYEPYMKPQKEIVDVNRSGPKSMQVKCMEKFIPMRTYTVTFINPTVTLATVNHPRCDITNAKLPTVRKKSSSKRGGAGSKATSKPAPNLPSLIGQVERFDLTISKPMYPNHVVKLVSKMKKPSPNLLHHCHSHISLKLFGLQAGLYHIESALPQMCRLLPPVSGAVYMKKLLLPMYWDDPHQLMTEVMCEMPKLVANATCSQVMLATQIALTWVSSSMIVNSLSRTSLLEDNFRPTVSRFPSGQLILEFSMTYAAMRLCDTRSSYSVSGSLNSVEVVISNTDQRTQLLQGPVNTQDAYSTDRYKRDAVTPQVAVAAAATAFNKDLLTFACQLAKTGGSPETVPSLILIEIQGVVGCVDPKLYEWLSYCPLVYQTAYPEKQPQQITRATSQDSNVSVMSSSQTRSRSQATKSKQSMTDKSVNEEPNAIHVFISRWLPVIERLIVQVHVHHWLLYLPTVSLELPDTSASLLDRIVTMYTGGPHPDVATVCLPELKLHNSAGSNLPYDLELPARRIEVNADVEKLPWRLEMKHMSVYSLHSDRKAFYLLKPMILSTTLAVASKEKPITSSPLSSELLSIACCIHVDVDSVRLASSRRQVVLLTSLWRNIGHVVDTLAFNVRTLGRLNARSASAPRSAAERQPSDGDVEVAPALNPVKSKASLLESQAEEELVEPHSAATSEDTASRSNREPLLWSETMPGLNDPSANQLLSVWLQLTVPKVLLRLYTGSQNGDEICVSTYIEDVTTSIDIQGQYQQVKSKIGVLNISHFTRSREEREWTAGPHEGILLSTVEKLSHNVDVLSNKQWTGGSSSGGGSSGRSPHQQRQHEIQLRDRTHGFLTFTFTRVQTIGLRRKLRQQSTAVTDDDDDQNREDGDMNSILDEICLNLNQFDVVFNVPVVMEIGELFRDDSGRRRRRSISRPYESDAGPRPMFRSRDLPLVYANLKSFRVFVPNCWTSASEPDTTTDVHSRSTAFHDMLVFHAGSLILSPQPDNPLPRRPVDRELCQLVAPRGLSSLPGSAVEDRQYQLDVRNLGLSTGVWNEIVIKSGCHSLKDEEILETQNPALEWNQLIAKELEDDIPLVPIAANVALRIVAAPAVVYEIDKKNNLLYGYSLEVNATSDIDFTLSTNQIHLIRAIVTATQESLNPDTPRHKPVTPRTTIADDCRQPVDATTEKAPTGLGTDSGVESEASTTRLAPLNLKRGGVGQLQTDLETSLEEALAGIEPIAIPITARRWTPFEILLTAGRISFMSYSHLDAMVTDDANRANPIIPVKPFLYAYFSQPHSLFSLRPATQKVELSCYDVLVKGAKNGEIIKEIGKVLPDTIDYSLHWLQTRPGEPNTKTGIPPSLYTLRITDFLNDEAQVFIAMERPLLATISTTKLEQVREFVDVLFSHSAMDDEIPRRTSETYEGENRADEPTYCRHLSHFKDVQLRAVQIKMVAETSPSPHEPSLSVNLTEIQAGFVLQKDQQGAVSDVTSDVLLKELLLATSYRGKWRPIVGPVSAAMSACIVWTAHSGPAYLPRVVSFINVKPFAIHFGQEHYIALNAFISHLNPFFNKNSDSSATSVLNTSAIKSGSRSDEETPPGGVDATTDYPVKRGIDDLRRGTFQYILEDVDQYYQPNPCEVVFCQNSERGTSLMTWCYPDPRMLTYVHVTPVPFNIDPDEDLGLTEDKPGVPCKLQYWDTVRRRFVDYQSFYVSETHECHVDLSPVENAVVTHMWRVEIFGQKLRVDECLNGDEEDEPIILPATLAASIHIDSMSIPSRVPIIQMCITIDRLYLQLYHHFNNSHRETPKCLQPFSLSYSHPEEQEYMTVTLDDVQIAVSHLYKQSSTIQLSSSVQCELLEYQFLTKQPFIEPCDLKLQLHHQQELQNQRLNCGIEMNPLFARISQSTVNTLAIAADIWSQTLQAPSGDSSARPPLVCHYLICNDTQDILRIGQVDTDESLIVQSREALPYSWRSHKLKPLFNITLAGKGWSRSRPIGLRRAECVVKIHNHLTDETIHLYIRIKQLTNIVKQVIICGTVIVSSRLSQHLEAKLVKTDDDTTATQLLGDEQTLPSYNVDATNAKGVKFKAMGTKAGWSDTLPFDRTGSHMVQIPTSVGFMYVWCTVFIKQFKDATINIMALSPVYVMKSRLPITMLINLHTPSLQSTQKYVARGHCQEDQLVMVVGDLDHSITMQMRPDSAVSDPPYSLSQDILKQTTLTKLQLIDDIDALCYNWNNNKEKCHPETQLQYNPDDEVDHAELDLQVTFVQQWPGFKTICLDIAPWCLIHNKMRTDIYIQTDEKQWKIQCGQTWAPPKTVVQFTVGIDIDGQIHPSSFVELSPRDTLENQYLPKIEGVLYQNGHTRASISILSNGSRYQTCFLTLQSVLRERVCHVSIKERYTLSNQTPRSFCVQNYTIQNQSKPIRSEELTVSSRDIRGHSSLPLTLWCSGRTNDADIKDPRDLVLYLRLKSDRSADWNFPLRLDRVKIPFGVAAHDEVCSSYSYLLTYHEFEGVIYLVISDDPNPQLMIHSNCPFPLYISESRSAGFAIEEDSHHIPSAIEIPADTCVHYSCYDQQSSRLHLGAMDTGRISWSAGIDVRSKHDAIANIPKTADVKIHVETWNYVCHVYVDTVSRAGVAATEVKTRERARGQELVVVMDTDAERTVGVERRRRHKSQRHRKLRGSGPVTPISVNLRVKHASFVLLDDQTESGVVTEISRCTLDNAIAATIPAVTDDDDARVAYFACVEKLQIDNQMHLDGGYDFPVVLLPIPAEKSTSSLNHFDYVDELTFERLDEMRRSAFCSVDVLVRDGGCRVHEIAVAVGPLSVYVEDKFVYDILKKVDSFVPTSRATASRTTTTTPAELPSTVCSELHRLTSQIRLHSLSVRPIQMYLSVHASMKLFLASDNTPLKFAEFTRTDLTASADRLLRMLVMHYASGALFRAGWVIGSLELVGNPTGLVQNVTRGVVDLLRLPMEGLGQGPGYFLSGVRQGFSSLLWHVSTGTVNSVTSFASSLSRNMDYLSLDEAHCLRQEEIRRRPPEQVGDGLKQGLTGFGLSLLGAVAGLAEQPLQGIQQVTDQSLSASQKVLGVISGFGKGLIGVVTKPVGGSAEFVARTGHGLLNGVGVGRLPGPWYKSVVVEVSTFSTGQWKFLAKTIESAATNEIISIIMATRVVVDAAATEQQYTDDVEDDDHTYECLPDVYIILSPQVLFIIDINEDCQQQAFAVTELDCLCSGSTSMVLMEWNSADDNKLQKEGDKKDRIADFVVGASSGRELSVTDRIAFAPAKVKYTFNCEQKSRDSFYTLFHIVRRKLLGKGFSVWGE
ncbi:intermembrane lipid transfer protein VPS13B-like [Tubulanus polymorphus]|uniref:intermembrane lipid transfer protein VPS13B-like n=1 Tax=Tubulanus polymorphus TaxID=672921 RepID=UPI003DA2B0E8